MRTACIFVALSLAGATRAQAEGINLSWDDCGAAGVPAKLFACNVNTGYDILFGSFVVAGIDTLIGLSAQVDIRSSTPALPQWWMHNDSVQPQEPRCRDTSGLAIDEDFTNGPNTCLPAIESDVPVVYDYDITFGAEPRARIRLSANRHLGGFISLDPSREYYAFRLLVFHTRATGPDSCSGCSVPVCIVLNNVEVFEPNYLEDYRILTNSQDRQYVTWQSTDIAGCPGSTPTRRSTWGQVRSLYR